MKDKQNFKNIAQKRQRNVIGCYLGLDLVTIRHGSDLFRHFTEILTLDRQKYKKYSPEEDRMILNEVADKGDELNTWKELSRKIRGDERGHFNIRRRYKLISNAKTNKCGNYSLEEDTAILEHLFTNKLRTISTIDMIKFSSFDNIKETKRDKKSISRRFEENLKPILLSYHLGSLGSNWKYGLFEYLVTKKYKGLKEIPWEEPKNLYPSQTTGSLTTCINSAVQNIAARKCNLSFTDALKEHQTKIKGSYDYTEAQKIYHQNFLDGYCNCTITYNAK